MPKYGVISGPHFHVFGLNTGKCRPEITPYLDNFHAVFFTLVKLDAHLKEDRIFKRKTNEKRTSDKIIKRSFRILKQLKQNLKLN